MKDQQKIIVPCADAYEFIMLSDLVRCEGLQNYSRIFLKDGSMLVCTYNIGMLKKQLAVHGFISCHKSHLINEAHIVRYAKEGYVQMVDESCVPVSRRQRSGFLSHVMNKYDIVSGLSRKLPVSRQLQQSINQMSP